MVTPFRILPFLVALALGAGLLPSAARAATAQDPGDALGRLAREQHRLAEQARRLEKLLGVLEEKEKAAGNPARATLLARARERLTQAGQEGDLVAVLEAVATDLAALRAGSAMESQAEVIALLQELLDSLLEWRVRSQLQALQDAARQRLEALSRLAAEQEQLAKETGRLEQEAKEAGEGDVREQEELARRQEALNEAMRDQQGQLGQSEKDHLERAERAGEEAAKLLDPSSKGAEEPPDGQPEEGTRPPDRPATPGELQQARERQEEALDALRDAERRAQEEVERLEQGDQAEELLDIARQARSLLERHQAVEAGLVGLIAELGPGRPPRSARVRLRQWSGEEKALADSAAELVVQIRGRGGDIFPFMLAGLRDDHGLLAGRLGPPGYRAGTREVELASRITAGWEELIEALRTEAERIRQQIQMPDQQQGPQESGEDPQQPLVDFASEVQLLKRLQEDMRERLDQLRRRRETLEAAGLEPDEDDLRELDRLAERQRELRRLYEAMLERLRQEQEGGSDRA